MRDANLGWIQWAVGGAVVTAVVLGGYWLYQLGMTRGKEIAAGAPAAGGLKTGAVDPATDRKVLYWHDPMVPGQRFDAPGQSPFMNMKLVPVYADDGGGESAVTVSPRVRQNLGVRTAMVTRKAIAPRVEAVGSIAFNERDQVIVQARATAYVERLHVRATLDRVTKGQPLAELYVPEWVAVQEEFLSLRRLRDTDLATLIDAARQRLRQAGMTDEQIRLVESQGSVQPRITLTAPIDGVVVELMAREGMAITLGETLFRINGLATVWVNAAVPESQTGLLRPGAAVEARSPAVPGTTFGGTVQAILPEVDAATRTIRARIELANTNQALAPGMFVNVAFSAAAGEALTIPSEALIRTGTRTVVIVADGGGAFRPVDVEVGLEWAGETEIRRGLEAGQSVVASGQFLIDSEASLRATSTRMSETASSPAATAVHTGEGTITAIGANTVTLQHGPIASIQWSAMTMEFILPPVDARPELRLAEHVRFAFTMGDDGRPRLTRIEPAEGGR